MIFEQRMNTLSIMIVTWNGDDLLGNCLSSIQKACGDTPEIVIVDNANLESTKQIVRKHPNAKYVPAPENLGFAGGNNLGLPHCTRPYVLLLNNDTIVHEQPFSCLIQYMEEHPKVAVVQGKMKLVSWGDVLDTCGTMLTPCGAGYDPFLMLPASSTRVTSHPVFSGKGACLMFRRDILAQLGGTLFYDHFHSNYEETDFCHRVWLTGNEVHFVDSPAIDHLQSRTISRLNQSQVQARTISNTLFSLLSTLEPLSIVRIVSRHLTIHCTLSCYHLCKGRLSDASAFWKALAMTIKRSRSICEARRYIATNRKIDDKTLFGKVMVHPPVAYYFHAYRGTLATYNKQHTA